MTKVTALFIVAALALFTAAWLFFPDVSSLPLCWLTSASMCGMFYVIDRWGFKQIDTIELLDYSPNFYLVYMGIYALLIVIGHVIGFGLVA